MAPNRAQPVSSPSLKDRRILVVEDDWFIADAVTHLLTKEGASVFGPATTVAEGAQLAAYWPIDIALMDLNLHGEWADDLVVELARKEIVVVVVSGYDVKKPVADSAFATLKKPVASAQLLNTLRQAVSVKATPRAAPDRPA
jgi:DNA-binding response OmpR family regulator